MAAQRPSIVMLCVVERWKVGVYLCDIMSLCSYPAGCSYQEYWNVFSRYSKTVILCCIRTETSYMYLPDTIWQPFLQPFLYSLYPSLSSCYCSKT